MRVQKTRKGVMIQVGDKDRSYEQKNAGVDQDDRGFHVAKLNKILFNIILIIGRECSRGSASLF